MGPRIIVTDGKTYNNVEEMPPVIRQKYGQAMRSLGDTKNNNIPVAFETMNIFADKDRNGAPDVLENIIAGQAAVSSIKIVLDGKEFNGIENLPPDVRARYEEAIRQLDANRNGAPDFVEGMISPANQGTVSSTERKAAASRHSPSLPACPTITPDTTSGWMLVLTGLFIFLLYAAGAAGVWYFVLS